MKQSLHLRINRTNLMAVLIILILFATFDISRSYITMKNAHTVALQTITKRLSSQLWGLVNDYYRTQIAEYIEREMDNNNVYAIIVRDKIDNSIIEGKIRTETWELRDYQPGDILDNYQNMKMEISKQDDVIGFVEVYFSMKFLNRELVNIMLMRLLTIIALLITTIISLNVALARHILKPIKQLNLDVKAISAGKYDQPVRIVKEDELGSLAGSFEKMRISILEKMASLSDYINRLNLEIKDRVQAQQEMKQLKIYLSNIIDSSPSILITIDMENRITEWNKTAVETLRIPRDHAIGTLIHEVYPPFKKYIHYFNDIIRQRRAAFFHRQEIEGINNIYFDVSLYPLQEQEQGAQGIVLRFDDITDIEKIEQELIQSQKMETIGTLAGGLAHDFNNVLSGILITLDVIKLNKTLDSSGTLKKYIDIIESAGNRAAEIVNQLMFLARKNKLNSINLNLKKSMENVIKICKNSFDKSIRIITEIDNGDYIIQGDPTQIEQVLLNLCVNANHAMTIMRDPSEKQGGTLKLSLSMVHLDSLFKSMHPDKNEGTYCMIEVSDTGVGMCREIQKKIFEPFYTTKNKESGTGLGLSMVYNNVQQHNGFIDVYSEPGIGTTFKVYYPAIEQEVIDTEDKEKAIEVVRGEGLILIIDDEPVIRQLGSEILEKCGYDVLTAQDGATGIHIYRENKEKIKVVLLDMSMPGLSGKETYMELVKIDPDIRVVITSGFILDKRVQDVIDLGAKSFIHKPFNARELSLVISRVM